MKKLIVANWKMNGDIHKLAQDVSEYINNPTTNASNVVLGLPFILLSIAHSQLYAHKIKLSAQDVSQFKNCGAYTGETSANMLKDSGVEYVIVGHSERRAYFTESDTVLLDKLNNTIELGLVPIFCVGESKEVRVKNEYCNFIESQLNILKQLNVKPNNIVIAYEPIWAIGTGLVPTVMQIQEVGKLIHTFIHKNPICDKITVLYGGSVSPSNIKEILSQPEIDGVLVGGASLKVSDFISICENA